MKIASFSLVYQDFVFTTAQNMNKFIDLFISIVSVLSLKIDKLPMREKMTAL